MGNWNSGPRRKHGSKRTVESCHVLSTRTLNREGLFNLGQNERQLTLAGADSLPEFLVDCVSVIGTESGKLSIDYDLPGVDGRLGCTIRLSSSPCQFGGRRWWIHCPMFGPRGWDCGRRAQKLYRSKWQFGCRQCQDLTYFTTQQSDRAIARMWKHSVDLDPQILPRMSLAMMGRTLKYCRYVQGRMSHSTRRMGE